MRSRWIVCILVLAASSTAALAVHTRFWEISGYEGMLSGQTDGLSLTREGVLLLAPDLTPIPLEIPGTGPQPFLWRAVVDAEGNLYVGSGIRGMIYRVTTSGEVSLYFTAAEIEVHALALDPEGNLLVGASPPGRIYRIEPSGRITILFEPPERYIWDLAVDDDGTVYAATGEQGILYRISPDGEGEPFFDSDEPHLVTLALDLDGTLVVGSSGSGLVIHVDREGTAQVLMDADGEEVSRVALGADGAIYAAVNRVVPPEKSSGEKEKDTDEKLSEDLFPDAAPVPRGLEDLTGPSEEIVLDGARQALLRLESSLYRIPASGPTRELWTSPDEGIHSMLVDGTERVYVGTGVPGRIYLLDGPSSPPQVLARFAASQVTALAGGGDRPLFALTSNPGGLHRAAQQHGQSGEYLSRVRDAGTTALWGRVQWEASTPSGSRVEISTRSGNSTFPDATWSPWSPASADKGASVRSPSARFLQLRARLSRLEEAGTPRLRAVQISYLEENRPPRLSDLGVGPSPPDEEAKGRGTPRNLEIAWNAEDPDGDVLWFDVRYRSSESGEDAWSDLALHQGGSPYRWDTRDVPAGRYQVQIRATDAADNDPETALTATLSGPPFVIDRDVPELEILSALGHAGGATISFRASDALSPVVSAYYRLNDGVERWRVQPDDGIADSLEERFELSLSGLAAGSHRIHLTVVDREGNRSEDSVPVEVSP
jgi:hypothetical protein